MSPGSGTRPVADLARVDRAQARFLAVLADRFDDDDVARASGLPGWRLGHLLSHVARNADSHRRRAEGAARGVTLEQYPGGYEGRAAAIDAGAARTANELVVDVRRSAERLRATWAALPVDVWAASTQDVAGTQRPLDQLPARRWHELEVHLVDLRLGVTHHDWSSDLVSVWLPRHRSSARRRLPDGSELPSGSAFGDEREELAWLLGRIDRPDLPTLAPWG